MQKQDFVKLLSAIQAGALTPSQMEDVVYAMHSAYVDHHEAICEQLPTNLEDVADTMVTARNNTERFGWEEETEKPLRQCDEEGAVQRFEGWMREMSGASL
jgi:hypothetical protein